MTTASAEPATDPRYAWFREAGDAEAVDALLVRVSGRTLAELASAPPAPAALPPRHTEHSTRILRWLRSGPRVPFIGLNVAVVADHLAHLGRLVEHADAVADPDELTRSLTLALLADTERILLRAQVHLLHDLRPTLTGDTSEQRFDAFEALVETDSGAAQFADRYPLAVRHAREAAAGFVGNIARVIERLGSHRAELHELGLDPATRLIRIEPGAGDRHAGGQSVCILTFEGEHRIVYKPRSLSIDRGYAVLLARIAEADPQLALPAVRVVDGGDYGFTEFLATDGTAPAVRPFFRAAGRLMALLHFLRGNDLHFQNFLLKDGAPTLVDVETLFAAVRPQGRSGDLRAVNALGDTVHTTGMLPSIMEDPRGDRPGIDVGALGYRPDQVSPFSTLVVQAPFTDTMHLQLSNLPSTLPSPFPTDADVLEEIEAVLEGFTAMYSWVMSHRELMADWVRELFNDVRLRFLAENTQRYMRTLRLATNPEVQAQPASWTALAHRIALVRDGVPDEVLRSEVRQLLDGDVPYFSVVGGQRDLWDPIGLCVPDLFVESPVEASIRIIEAAGAESLALNRWIVRLSYIARLPRSADRTGFQLEASSGSAAPDRSLSAPTRHGSSPSAQARDAALHAVEQICERIRRVRLPSEDPFPATWLGALISPTAYQYWKVGELGIDLYAGSTGLARTLALGGIALERPEWVRDGMDYLAPIIERLEQLDSSFTGLRRSAVTGVESLVRTAVDMAQSLGDHDLERRATGLWVRAVADQPTDRPADVMLGTAGLLGASVGLAARAATREPEVFAAAAHRLRARLIADLQDERVRTLAGGDPLAYSGYAHGIAGLYAQLGRYAVLPGSAPVTTLIVDLLDREVEFFDEQIEQWRFGDHGSTGAFGWCHGAPGLLLAKAELRAAQPAFADRLDADIERLVRISRTKAFGHNLSLCHGDIGNLWTLRHVAALLGDERLARDVAEGTDRYVRDVLPVVIENRLNRHSINHSLMLGQAGVASFLLDVYAPEAPAAPVLWFG